MPGVLSRPELAHYVAGWPSPGDLGVLAVDGQQPVGAAWLRLLPESDPGYGFVDAATPELSMGVVQAWRKRGVGRRLLDALVAAAREQGLASLSLSVEIDNYARRLYERVGFRQVGEVNGSVTMLLRLGVPSDRRPEKPSAGHRSWLDSPVLYPSVRNAPDPVNPVPVRAPATPMNSQALVRGAVGCAVEPPTPGEGAARDCAPPDTSVPVVAQNYSESRELHRP